MSSSSYPGHISSFSAAAYFLPLSPLLLRHCLAKELLRLALEGVRVRLARHIRHTQFLPLTAW